MPLRPSSWYEEKRTNENIYITAWRIGRLPMQAQTMHDWENHHVLQINRKPARAAFTPFSVQKGDC